MKKQSSIWRSAILWSGLIVLTATMPTLAQEADFVAPEEPQYVPGEVLVKYREGVTAATMGALAESLSLKAIDTFDFVGVQQAQVPEDKTVEDMIAKITARPEVEYVEPNYIVYAEKTPNDPSYPQLWGLKKIQAEGAWDTTTDSPKVIVAVIDTGVDYRHPDLRANMWKNPNEQANGRDDDGNGIIDDIYGANFVPSGATGDPMDDHSHGTHVAGTIGAVGNNRTGVVGVTWKTQIMALKFLSASGSGSTANAIRAIDYGIKKGAHIMNNSWGGGGFSRALEDAIKRANAKGILFPAAAGNTGTNDNDTRPHYPSSYNVPNVLAVMATDPADKKASFSSFGRTSVDLAAPGVNILSTIPGGQYRAFNGTSMATPHVSGAAALLKGKNPQWKAAELKAHLMKTVDKLASLKNLCVTEGRLNLAKAIGGIIPQPKCADGPSLLAYNEFFWPANKQFSSNSNVLSVSFTLPKAMYVYVSADSSARVVKGTAPKNFTTGLYTGSATNVMWTGSYRRGSFESAGEITPVHTSFALKLPKGTHTFYWKLWLSGYTMRFDSGTLAVRAFPCSIGGTLKSASGEGVAESEKVEVTILKEEELVTKTATDGTELDITVLEEEEMSSMPETMPNQ